MPGVCAVVKVLAALMLLLGFQSCSLDNIGRKDHRVQMPEPEEVVWTIKSDRANGTDGYRCVSIPQGVQMHPVCLYDDGGKYVRHVMRLADGRQLSVEKYHTDGGLGNPQMRFNYRYRHFVGDSEASVKGLPLADLVERWGDYMFVGNDSDTEDAPMVYTFPHVMLLQDGRYLNGVRVSVTADGRVAGVESMRKVQRNLFGSLPGYESVLRMNLMEWIFPGPWLQPGQGVPSRGFFASLFCSIGLYLLVVIVLAVVVFAVGFIVDTLCPKIRWWIVCPMIVGVLCVEYISAVSILDFYSAAWALSVWFILGLSAAPFVVVLGGMRHYCPKCNGYKWKSDTWMCGVEVSAPEFRQVWRNGGPCLELKRDDALMKITRKSAEVCEGCGYRDEEKTVSDELHARTLCPRCFRETVKGSFSYIRVDARNIEAEYVEECYSPGCCYRMPYHMKAPVISKPVPVAPRPKRVSPASGASTSPESSVGDGRVKVNCPHKTFSGGCYLNNGWSCAVEEGASSCPYGLREG